MANQSPTSYKDPYWTNLSNKVEKKLGLPPNSLVSIVQYGERTNNDQVSSAGARTVYQIIEPTRKGVLKNYGIDASLSDENAAMAAGYVLKEGLQRNRNDLALAAKEYNAGLDPKRWDKTVQSYGDRVMQGFRALNQGATGQAGTAQAAQPPAGGSGQASTFQRVMAGRAAAETGASTNAISNVYKAYQSGQMTPQEASEFEADVNAGKVLLPRGASLNAAPTQAAQATAATAGGVPELPAGVVQAYTSNQMSREEKMELERDIANGLVKAPAGMQVGSTEEPKTTVQGVTGAITRGLAPAAAGAALGAMAGAPIAGVGAIPGAIAGAGAATLAQVVGDPLVGAVNSLMGTQYTMPTKAMNDLLTQAGVAVPSTPTERVIQSTVSGATGAGGLAAAGRAVQTAAGAAAPVTAAVGKMIAAQPAAQLAGGAGAGLAGQAAQEMGAGTGGQIAASLAGGIAGARMATPRVTVPTPASAPAVADDLAAAQRAGVKVMTSDVNPPKTFASKWLQTAGERVPIAGTGPVRQAQQTQRVDAVRNILRDFGADDAAGLSDDVMRDLAAKRSADLTKYSGAKTEVIERLGQAGTVPMTNTVQAIDDQIARLQGLKTQEVQPIVDRLTDWKTSIQGQNLVNVETLRKQIGESFKAPELSAVRSTGEKVLSSIYKPLKSDMESFIQQNGQRRDVTKWKVADKRLAEMSGELNMGALKSVLKRGDATPEVINNMLFSQKPSEIRQLYSSLTPDGRQNARAAILARAAEKATTEGAQGAVVSPDRFANEVKRIGNSVGIFFKDDDLNQVKGLVRVLNLTKRAGEAAAAPPTGVQTAIPVSAAALASVFGGGLPGFAATLGAAGGVGMAARLYESAPVRNAMIKLSKTTVRGKEEAALLKRLAATIQQQQQSQTSKKKDQ